MSARGGQFTFLTYTGLKEISVTIFAKLLINKIRYCRLFCFSPLREIPRRSTATGTSLGSSRTLPDPETIDVTNLKCLLFFKIDLQEYFAVLICLSADEICQPFSWGGNFYVDSGS
jgi:hypothetical protein